MKTMLGIDVVQISRIEALREKPAFLRRAFTAAELEYYKKGGERAGTLAGMYALKEAAAKALGTGFDGFKLKDIEISHTDAGAPLVLFHGKALELFQRTGAESAACSVSHEREYAVAICLLGVSG